MNTDKITHPRSSEISISQLIARQIEQEEALALVGESETLSYGELNRRANQLAHHLRRLGAGPETLVGCCLERSPEMVVAFLAILRAGAAYLPLDPAYPAGRLNFMLRDAQAPILITRERLLPSSIPATTHVICLDRDAALLEAECTAEPARQPAPEDLAYVIYTSGSTGEPKGVEITHRSLLNLISWHLEAFEVTAADRATQVTSPAFDATGWEVWPYLVAGACIYFPDEETRVTPSLLHDWLLRHKITISFLPTHLAESLLTLEWPAETPLRLLLTGADTLRHYPPVGLPFELVNNYGPTEATVVATSSRIAPNELPARPPSIGRPISNVEIYILDEALQQVPQGAVGEIYIGGAGLARGYHHRPELTAERFIRHPFSSEPGARLYRTGDLASFLPDGEIQFLGRIDQQIKIRGYRIEPDEIAFRLNKQPGVQTSAVVVRGETPDERRLVAYLVLTPDAQVTDQELRTALEAQLPEYMIPSTFVVLDELPLTPNGKLAQAALPAPDASNTLTNEAFAAPATPVEEELAEIISELLHLERVSIDDNFFMLGGHSLLGTQVIMRVAETFGVKLTLRALFDAPTVRELAAEIEQQILAKLEAMSEEEAELYLGQSL